jgi:hypothetical protein
MGPQVLAATPKEAQVNARSWSVLLLLALAAAPARAGSSGYNPATGVEGMEAGAEAEAAVFPLGATLVFETSLGMGTLIADQYERRPLLTGLLDFQPYAKLWRDLMLVGRVRLLKELVSNAGSSTTSNRETVLYDTDFTFQWNRAYVVPASVPVLSDLSVAPMVVLSAPTSKASRYATQVLSVRPGFILTKPLGPVSLAYWFRFTKNFHRYTSPTVDLAEQGLVAVPRPGGAEDLTNTLVAVDGNNVEWSILNRLTVAWSILDNLSLTVDYILTNAWTYRSYPQDDLTGEHARSGRGQRDATQGTVDLTWGVTGPLYLSLGVTTYQPPLTQDNGGLRWPLLNFFERANNFTTFYFDVTCVF